MHHSQARRGGRRGESLVSAVPHALNHGGISPLLHTYTCDDKINTARNTVLNLLVAYGV